MCASVSDLEGATDPVVVCEPGQPLVVPRVLSDPHTLPLEERRYPLVQLRPMVPEIVLHVLFMTLHFVMLSEK